MPSSGLKFKHTTFFGILLLVLPAASTTRADAKTVKSVVGIACYYGRSHQGRRMANGKRFDERKLTAASRQLPLGSLARVTSLRNKRPSLSQSRNIDAMRSRASFNRAMYASITETIS